MWQASVTPGQADAAIAGSDELEGLEDAARQLCKQRVFEGMSFAVQRCQ